MLSLRASVPLFTHRRGCKCSGAARKGEGKVNNLIGMSTISQTYLTLKSWELLLEPDTFLGEENSQASRVSNANSNTSFLFSSREFPPIMSILRDSHFYFHTNTLAARLWSSSLVHSYWYFLYKLWSIDCSRNQKQKLSEQRIPKKKRKKKVCF